MLYKGLTASKSQQDTSELALTSKVQSTFKKGTALSQHKLSMSTGARSSLTALLCFAHGPQKQLDLQREASQVVLCDI